MKANLIEKIRFGIGVSGDEDVDFDGESRLFGEAFLPEKWLETDEFSPFEFYVGIINLDDFSVEKEVGGGYLYLFAEAKNFDFSRVSAKVRLFSGDIDAYTDFNEGFFDDEEVEKRSFLIVPSKTGDDCVLFPDGDDVVIVSIKSEFLPFEINGDVLEYRIKKADFDLKKFDKCFIKIK